MENMPGYKNSSKFQLIITVLTILMIIDLIYLNIVYFTDYEGITFKTKKPISSPIQIPTIAATSGNTQMCPNSCLTEIYNSTTSSRISTPNLTPTKAPAPTKTISSTKEFFVPFGSGSNSSSDWEDVAGLKASIDTTKYSTIKNVVFEASVTIPTGNQTAYVRLFNETDQHPVWFSEVSLEGGTPQLLISKPITLESSNKVYKVQMKTSLKYKAVLDQARVHITTN